MPPRLKSIMQTPDGKILTLVILIAGLSFSVAAQPSRKRTGDARLKTVPPATLMQIIRVEDERRWDDSLEKLLADSDANVRKRAALAAGRIGNHAAVPALAEMLLTDRDNDVRQMAAFALGEIEAPEGAYALTQVLKKLGEENGNVRARAVEALGKIVAAMASAPASTDPGTKAPAEDLLTTLRAAIADALKFENERRSRPDRLTILLGLTAVLRTKPDGVGKLITDFLDYSDGRIVADALNTLARLRLKDGNDKARDLLAKHEDPIVRANAARVLGATEDKPAFDILLDRALHDSDLRVRVSAIRALGSLKDVRAGARLRERGETLLLAYRGRRGANPSEKNELLEIITSLGRVLQNSNDTKAIDFLKRLRILDQLQSPETEVAFARISPEEYLRSEPFIGTNEKVAEVFPKLDTTWRASNSLAQGLAELANLPTSQKHLRGMALMNFALMIEQPASHDPATVTAIPAYLRAYASFRNEVEEPEAPGMSRPGMLGQTLRAYVTYRPKTARQSASYVSWDNYRAFGYNDVIVRATAAELLAEQPVSKENTEALITALGQALKFDSHDNDAALAILDALAKQKNTEGNEAIKRGLDSKDHLIRRRAVALLKANGVGDFSDRIGTVKTRNTDADYRRAIARIGKKPTATVVTTKGVFTIEFLPDDATLNVDNFIQLAKKGYFNGQTVPRVVPNFVVQTGDPRGDQNGGPGYTIRCEINEVPYERAAVGMALSGKDTGGSQWFVTHSPQPHLDGGYTVFGRVIRGMETVDQIARGDRIVRVVVNER